MACSQSDMRRNSLERRKERRRIHDRRETIRGGTAYTVANIGCPCTLQRCVFSTLALQLTQGAKPASSGNNCQLLEAGVSNEGKRSRKRIEEIIVKHCLINTGLPQCHLLSRCSSALQDMTQQ